MTPKKMNELLHHANPSTKKLENDINIYLKDGIRCESIIDKNCKEIIINFFKNNETERFSHITLHLEKRE